MQAPGLVCHLCMLAVAASLPDRPDATARFIKAVWIKVITQELKLQLQHAQQEVAAMQYSCSSEWQS